MAAPRIVAAFSNTVFGAIIALMSDTASRHLLIIINNF